MIKRFTIGIGAALLMAGILGFVPGMSITDAGGRQMLFGIFMVGPFHNAFHLVSGAVGLLAAMTDTYARWYLRIFGTVYAVLAVVGFAVGIGGVNMADNLLHAVVAVVLLSIGFVMKIEDSHTLSAQPNRKESTL